METVQDKNKKSWIDRLLDDINASVGELFILFVGTIYVTVYVVTFPLWLPFYIAIQLGRLYNRIKYRKVSSALKDSSSGDRPKEC